MARTKDRIASIKLNDAASARIVNRMKEIATQAMYQSKILASIDKADHVQSVHVDAALELITRRERTDWRREFFKILGGALFGAFIPGIATSLNPQNITFLLLFVGLGLAGMLCVFLGLRK